MTNTLFRVKVRHNVVQTVEIAEFSDGVHVARDNLEAGEMMANNHRHNGCLDGVYYFDDPGRARMFAKLCLDFVRKLIEKQEEIIDNLNLTEGRNQ